MREPRRFPRVQRQPDVRLNKKREKLPLRLFEVHIYVHAACFGRVSNSLNETEKSRAYNLVLGYHGMHFQAIKLRTLPPNLPLLKL
jgi:hypothetical protein